VRAEVLLDERQRSRDGQARAASDTGVKLQAAAVIFDFDGLILDTETPIFEAWRAAYRRHGHELGLERWQHSLGTSNGFDPYRHLCDLLGDAAAPEREALLLEIQDQNWAQCERQELLPGVVTVLDAAHAAGLRTAVASSSSVGWVERWLGRHGIRERFGAVCGRDDVAHVKPAPDLYLLAAQRLDVDPAACLVFEDSPNGIRAARAAGMRCVAVPNGLTGQLALPDPDLVVSSLAERPLGDMLAAVGFKTR
jgi:HAD superfamily hydrolase (TIGR01509 family)